MNTDARPGRQAAPHRSESIHIDTAATTTAVVTGFQAANRDLLESDLKHQMAILRGTVDQCFSELARIFRNEIKAPGQEEIISPHDSARDEVKAALGRGVILPEGASLTWEGKGSIEGALHLRSGDHELRWRERSQIYLRHSSGKELLFINGSSPESIELKVERRLHPQLTVSEHSDKFIAAERQRRVETAESEFGKETAAYNSFARRVSRSWDRFRGNDVAEPPVKKELALLSSLWFGDEQATPAIMKRTAEYVGVASGLVRDLGDALVGIYDVYFNAASLKQAQR